MFFSSCMTTFGRSLLRAQQARGWSMGSSSESGWLSTTTPSTSSSSSSSGSSGSSRARELRLALVGAPGCGKGTHASKLSATYGLTALSTGNLLREAIANKKLDQQSIDIINSGGLVPNKVVVGLLEPTLRQLASDKKGWVLDGFPRKLDQAEELQLILKKIQQPLDAVLFIDVDPAVIVSRVADRRVHLPSGRVYNLSFSPPKVPGKDDVTGEDLVQRDDDKPETVQARLVEYEKQTKPILDFYTSLGLLVVIPSPTSPQGWVRIQQYLSAKYP